MIVNKPISKMTHFEFEDMMITLRAQIYQLHTQATSELKKDISRFYIQIVLLLLTPKTASPALAGRRFRGELPFRKFLVRFATMPKVMRNGQKKFLSKATKRLKTFF